jgi:hypothetical protein
MWSSFKAAFAATGGILVAWKLAEMIADPAFRKEMQTKAKAFTSDWTESRKISHSERSERD